MTLMRPPERAPVMSRANRVGAIAGGRETNPWKVLPAKTKLRAVTVRMLASSAARTFRTERTATIRNPITASTASGLCRSPRVTKVAGLAAIRPAFLSAIIARKRPIPTVMAMRMERGMPAMMSARRPVRVTIRKHRPEMNTAPKAACQEKPRPWTTT